MEEKVTLEEATDQVMLMATRMATLYIHFSEVIIEELGEEKGKDLIKNAIMSYGAECGARVREKALEKGLSLDAKNYGAVPDLPSLLWKGEKADYSPPEGDAIKVSFCPLAHYWKGVHKEELGRIYCFVDEAKYESFNPELKCTHIKNILEGDPYCEMVIEKKS